MAQGTQTPEIKAIETRYAGCRFRSRLEARWAVFFDTLGVRWEYEEEGYEIEGVSTRYLPDFWLPKWHLWVEVKGVLDQPSFAKLVAAAGPDGLPHREPVPDIQVPRILLLGGIPEPGERWLHCRFDLVADVHVVLVHSAFFAVGEGRFVSHQVGAPIWITDPDVSSENLERLLLACRGPGSPLPGTPLPNAYAAARSARFEFGESG